MLFLGKKTEPRLDFLQTWSQGNPFARVEDNYRPSNVARLTPATIQGPRTCSNIQCTAMWTAPWRSRKRPVFEEQWGCSGRCVLEMVRAAVQREVGNGMENAPVRHRHRVPLGLLLLAQGWITPPQLQYALDVQREHGGRIGEVLVAHCDVDPDRITRALSLQWSCPVLSASGFSPREMALVAPRTFVEQFGLLPVRVAGSRILYLGFEDRLDASAALALEQMSGLIVESGLMKTREYESARLAFLESDALELKEESYGEADAMAARITAILEQKQPVASKLVRVHRYYWLRLWLEAAAHRPQERLARNGEDMLDYIFTIGK